MIQTPLTTYEQRISDGEIKPDPIQADAVLALQRLFDDVIEIEGAPKKSFLQRVIGGGKPADIPLGVYMHGGVGRGKSMLMDLFYDCLPEKVPKRRVHFHEFMIEVHDYIHSRSLDGGTLGMVEQALPSLAGLIYNKSRILCFDEFHVVDIADAMILGRLFKILFEKGVIVVATSNWAPGDLYKDGLQRDRFKPFIQLLKTKVQTVHLDSPHDYRKQTVQVEGTYFTPLNRATQKDMDALFKHLLDGQKPKKDSFEVKGRKIAVKQTADGIARFTFAQLCERPHGAEDYLEIARRYQTVFLEGVPKLSYDRRNEVKRLMNLIDALYEARAQVIISAEKDPHNLYAGRDHAYEFERTISRLMEMQSENYP